MNMTTENELVIDAQNIGQKSLSEQVADSVDALLTKIKATGKNPVDVYRTVMDEVEVPLYRAIMRFTKGNQVKAAKFLGISRGTLRKKLAQYFGTTQIGQKDNI